MFNYNKMNRRQKLMGMAVVLIVGLWLFWVFQRRRKQSGYREINTGSDEVPNMFAIKSSVSCVPGPSPNAAYYTDSQSGGLCSDQSYVHKMGHEYMINDGVGGSLLSSM